MPITDLVSIITSIGVLGTLLLGFINLHSLRKSEQRARQYSLNTADYEKRRDFILTNLTEYLQLLDVHELSFMASTDEEYEGKDLDIYKKLYNLETIYYKIKLMVNADNLYCEKFLESLDKSMLLARTIRTENSSAEFFSNGLRTPERALEISNRALGYQKKMMNKDTDRSIVTIDIEADDKEKLEFIGEAVKSRNLHIENYLTATKELSEQKAILVATAQKYLLEEKTHLLT